MLPMISFYLTAVFNFYVCIIQLQAMKMKKL